MLLGINKEMRIAFTYVYHRSRNLTWFIRLGKVSNEFSNLNNSASKISKSIDIHYVDPLAMVLI
jgi:hypothetical protein